MSADQQQAASAPSQTIKSSSGSGGLAPGDEVAIITGSASGIGQGTALAFAALNYRLALVDKNAERLTETANMCQQKSPKGHRVSFCT